MLGAENAATEARRVAPESRRATLRHNGQSLASERGAGLCTAWWCYGFHNFSFVAAGMETSLEREMHAIRCTALREPTLWAVAPDRPLGSG